MFHFLGEMESRTPGSSAAFLVLAAMLMVSLAGAALVMVGPPRRR